MKKIYQIGKIYCTIVDFLSGFNITRGDKLLLISINKEAGELDLISLVTLDKVSFSTTVAAVFLTENYSE